MSQVYPVLNENNVRYRKDVDRLKGGNEESSSSSSSDEEDFVTMGPEEELEASIKFIKICMFVSNSLIFIGGVIILILGAWTIQEKGFINELVGSALFFAAVYLLMASGIVICGIAFIGILAALRELKFLLVSYAMMVSVMMLVILVACIIIYVFRDIVHITMKEEMYNSIKAYGEEKQISRAWDDTQELLQCCGVESYSDWRGHIPESCCRVSSGKRVNCKVFQTSLNIWRDGCLNATEKFIRRHASAIAGSAITVSALMLMSLILGLTMHKVLHDKDKDKEVESDSMDS